MLLITNYIIRYRIFIFLFLIIGCEHQDRILSVDVERTGINLNVLNREKSDRFFVRDEVYSHKIFYNIYNYTAYKEYTPITEIEILDLKKYRDIDSTRVIYFSNQSQPEYGFAVEDDKYLNSFKKVKSNSSRRFHIEFEEISGKLSKDSDYGSFVHESDTLSIGELLERIIQEKKYLTCKLIYRFNPSTESKWIRMAKKIGIDEDDLFTGTFTSNKFKIYDLENLVKYQ